MSEFKSLRLLKSSNFKDLEILAAEIVASDTVKLQIPNSLSYSGGFGMEGAALQVLATWLRSSQPNYLHTSVTDPLNSNQFEDLCNSIFGLCALRLSDVIMTTHKTKVDLAVALRPAIPIFESIRRENFRASFKGLYFAIPSIKSTVIKSRKDREFDNPLYNGESVVGAKKFLDITKMALKAIYPLPSNIDWINGPIVTHISEILRELFTNTHRHARTDCFGNMYGKNFRAIIFNANDLSKERLNEISKSGGAKLASFFAEWLPSGNKKFRALDITVVDSGPGYARRWKGVDKENLTLEQEKEAVVDCFTKHRSTEFSDSSGSGLSNVLKDLKELKGWFRLRTGRTLVEKSFFNREGSDRLSLEDIKVVDNFVEGVVFNVVIPLESLSGK